MRSNNSNILFQLDWVIILLYLMLVVAGWFSIYATTATVDFLGLLNVETRYGKQSVWILLSLVIIVFILALEADFYERYASVFYVFSIVFLLGLFLFGNTVKGQTNWYSFGGFSIQPAEFVKVTTALAVAKIMSDHIFDIRKIMDFKNVLLVLFLPFVIILLLPDVGSAIVYTSFIFVLLKEKMPSAYFYFSLVFVMIFIATVKFGAISIFILLLLSLALFSYFSYKRNALFFRKNMIALIVFVFGIIISVFGSSLAHKHGLKKHHKDRLALWLRLEKDPVKLKYLKRDYGYNNDQSVKAIASGGLLGKGFLQGDRTNGNFVPEQHTDYVFSAVGEEFGFFGSSLVVVLFIFLILRILYRAEQQRSSFSKIYGYGVASILFFHFAINIGMVTDLLPTVGIPLPFFSYGGSSLWGFTILIFIFIRLDANRVNEL